jgi:hypothetical protein
MSVLSQWLGLEKLDKRLDWAIVCRMQDCIFDFISYGVASLIINPSELVKVTLIIESKQFNYQAIEITGY